MQNDETCAMNGPAVKEKCQAGPQDEEQGEVSRSECTYIPLGAYQIRRKAQAQPHSATIPFAAQDR